MTIKLLVLLLFTSLSFAIVPATVAVAQVDPLKEICLQEPSATACQGRTPTGKNPLFGPDGILTKVINILSIVVGIAAVIGIMEGGLKFIRSGDNPQEVSSARGRVLNSIFALILAVCAQLLVRFILYKIT